MSFGDKVIDLFMPTKKEHNQGNSDQTGSKPKPEVEDFTKLIDRDSLHSLFPFSWEQYPTYVQSGENFIRVLAIADYPKRVYGNWLSELKRKKGVIDIPSTMETDGNLQNVRTSINLSAKQVNEYLDEIKKEMNINYLDLGEYHFNGEEFDETEGLKNEIATYKDKVVSFKIKKYEKPIRFFAIKEMKNFLAKPDGNVHLSVVTHVIPPESTKKKKSKNK